ncbi:MAG TPA: hypothetical protein VKB79_16165 [Bryobacteraceae bacterium]|nr:hypothetical protein [Bryobacteraceae bacterium]
MIATDTSTWIAYLQGDEGEDTQMLEVALAERRVFMPPPALTEVLSDPKFPETAFGIGNRDHPLSGVTSAAGFVAPANEM